EGWLDYRQRIENFPIYSHHTSLKIDRPFNQHSLIIPSEDTVMNEQNQIEGHTADESMGEVL
ncbi:hypothetical protein CU097_002859, partial [Rhizopus azygosporus]